MPFRPLGIRAKNVQVASGVDSEEIRWKFSELLNGHASRLARLLDPDQKGVCQTDTNRGTQALTVVSESGFYDVVSRLDPDQKGIHQMATNRGTQALTVVSESGFYDLLVSSGPGSKRF